MEYLSFWALYFITGTSHQLMYSWNRTQVVLRISLVSFASLAIIGSITEALLTGALVRDAQEHFSPEMFSGVSGTTVCLKCSCAELLFRFSVFSTSSPPQRNSAAKQTCRHVKVQVWACSHKSYAFGAPVFVFFHQVKVSLKILSNLLFALVDLCSHNILPNRCKVRMCLHGRNGVRLGVFNPFFCLLILSCK